MCFVIRWLSSYYWRDRQCGCVSVCVDDVVWCGLTVFGGTRVVIVSLWTCGRKIKRTLLTWRRPFLSHHPPPPPPPPLGNSWWVCCSGRAPLLCPVCGGSAATAPIVSCCCCVVYVDYLCCEGLIGCHQWQGLVWEPVVLWQWYHSLVTTAATLLSQVLGRLWLTAPQDHNPHCVRDRVHSHTILVSDDHRWKGAWEIATAFMS